MKKTLLIIVAIALVMWIYAVSKYNNFVVMDEKVKYSWSQVENQFQRRADLIPQLVATVSNYASHEKETFEAVTKARSDALDIDVNIDNLDQIQAFYEKQWALTQALSKLMMLQENYPDLKAAPLFSDLQTQLEGTENRISTERWRYNEQVLVYNSTVRTFPNNMISWMFGLWEKPVFESIQWADTAPDVQNLFNQ